MAVSPRRRGTGNDPRQPATYEGITVGFRFRETARGFVVDHAEYVPTYWNHYGDSGRPIRIQRVVRALAHGVGDQDRLREALRETRAAVDLLGHAEGLVER